MIKVFFNDKCSICSKEINHYKKVNSKNINWIDINDLEVSSKLTNKNHKELLRRLHVVHNKNVYSGVKAFIIMWSYLPRYKWISRLVSLPVIYHLSCLIYEFIALGLYYKNYHQLNEKD
tara:strand:+ start:995 stop:1351 length:357 start_codon:yes stop_codon:yes gene_type:complete